MGSKSPLAACVSCGKALYEEETPDGFGGFSIKCQEHGCPEKPELGAASREGVRGLWNRMMTNFIAATPTAGSRGTP